MFYSSPINDKDKCDDNVKDKEGTDRTDVSGFAGIKLEDVRGIRAPFLAIGGNRLPLSWRLI